jgi:hypothetical protein
MAFLLLTILDVIKSRVQLGSQFLDLAGEHLPIWLIIQVIPISKA